MSKISIVEALRLLAEANKEYVSETGGNLSDSMKTLNDRVDNLLTKYPTFSSNNRQTELEDIRQGLTNEKFDKFNGEKYTSAGTAVRTQLSLILDYLDTLDQNIQKKADGYEIDNDSKFYLLSNGERITGGVSIATDLSGYYTKDEVNGILPNYASADDLAALKETVANLNALEDLDIEFDNTTHELSWYKKGDAVPLGTITIEGTGSGSGGNGITFKMTYDPEIPSSMTTIYKGEEKTYIGFNWSSVYSDDGISTGNGSIVVNINGVKVDQNTNVTQGYYSYDVTDFLIRGSNSVQVILTDNAGNVRSLRWTITTVSLELTSTFNAYQAYYDNAVFTYTVTAGGSFEKTVHFELYSAGTNKTVIWSKDIISSTSGGISTQEIPFKGHGAYPLKVWVTANLNGAELVSNELYYEIIFVSRGNGTPIIASSFTQTEVTEYDNVSIPYLIWDPNYSTANNNSGRQCSLEEWYFDAEANDGEGEWVRANSISINPDRTLQHWTLKFTNTYPRRLIIRCGNQSRTIELKVKDLEIDVKPITNSLEVNFSAVGRSNAQSNYNSWVSNGYAAEFPTSFDWINGGWQPDENGATVLRIKASNDKVTIPLKLFKQDFKNSGKAIKIIFKCKNSVNYDTEVINCFDESSNIGLRLFANKSIFNSRDISMEIPYKEDSYIEMDLVVYPSTQNSLILWYLQGIPCSAAIYENDDLFVQTNPVNITLGSSECDLDIYLIKTYNKVLDQYEVLNNFILDAPTSDEIIARYQRNNIYDAYHNIVLDKLQSKYMIINSDSSQYPFIFPTSKIKDRNNPPVRGEVTYVDPNNNRKSFTSKNVGIGMQGTSSAGYGRAALNLNMDFHVDGFNHADTGTKESTFMISDKSLGVDYFCMKVDVASSESANNVILTDEYNLYDPYISDPQLDELLEMAEAKGYEPKADRDTQRDELITELHNQGFTNKIRGTIEGQPIVMFHRNTADPNPELTFYAKANMNNDKINYNVFGQDRSKYPQQSCVEFLTNESALCSFKSANFDNNAWEEGFEFRFPKKGYTQTDIDNLHRVVAWVNSTDTAAATGNMLPESKVYDGKTYTEDTAEYRLAKFKAEFEDYFIKSSTIWLYIFTERYLMVDNRAKNVFMATDDGKHWHFKYDYDNDTALGIDNIGRLSHSYGVEYRDGSQSYGGEDSVLWINLEKCFADDIQKMVQEKENEGAFNASRLSKKFSDYQANWCEAIWIEDMFKKYINPYINANDRTYISMMLGNKQLQRDWFLFYQDRYMSSKYEGPTAVSDAIQMRITKPTDNKVVIPNQNLTITPYSDMYVLVKYGNGDYIKKKAKRGTPVTINAPDFTSTGSGGVETYVYNASLLTSLGDLAPAYLSWLDISQAKKLKEVLLGSEIAGYQNDAWANGTNISFNSNLLKKIVLTGLTNLNVTIGLNNCIALKYFYAENTNIPSVTLAANSNIEILKLPRNITNIKLQNLSHLSVLTLQGYDSLSTITIERCDPSADQLLVNIIKQAKNLQTLRLIDIQWHLDGNGEEVFNQLLKCKGLDEAGIIYNGNTNPYISGTIDVAQIENAAMETYKRYMPNINILYGRHLYTVTFKNYDGITLCSYQIIGGEDGYNPINFNGYNADGTAYDPNNFGGLDYVSIDTPTKPTDNQYNYYYSSWSGSYLKVTEDRTLIATFTPKLRHYNIYFFKQDYDTAIKNLDIVTPYFSITGTEEDASGNPSTAIAYGSDVDMNTVEDPLKDEDLNKWLKGGWTIIRVPGWRIDTFKFPENFGSLDSMESLSVNAVNGTIYCFAVASKIELPSTEPMEFSDCSWGQIQAIINAVTAGTKKYTDYGWKLGQDKSITLNPDERGIKQTEQLVLTDMSDSGITLLTNMLSLKAYQMNSQERKAYCYKIGNIDADSDNFVYEHTEDTTSVIIAPTFNKVDRLGRPLFTKITVTSADGSSIVYDLTQSKLPSGIILTKNNGNAIWNAAGFTELAGDATLTIPVTKGATIRINTFLKGASWNNGGWWYSELREIANNDIYNLLPGLVQAVISPKTRKNSVGNYTEIQVTGGTSLAAESDEEKFFNDYWSNSNTGTIIKMNNTSTFITDTDKVWIPNNAEISKIAMDVDRYPIYAQEGSTFAVFTDDPSRVRKRPEEAVNVNNQHYWLASTYIEYVDEDNQEFISYPSGFGAVNSEGKWNSNYPAYSYFPCAFAIFIGKK